MDISTCWFKGNCPREKKSGCKSYCSIFQEFDYLINNSNIPADYMKSKTLYPMDVDYEAFTTLKQIQLDIDNFVKDGRTLYLWSTQLGNGKSSWAVKLLKTFLAVRCVGNNFKDLAYFIYTPTFLLDMKNFSKQEERNELMESVMNRELVVIDDLGAVQGSQYDLTNLSALIDKRYSSGLATIYTSNLSVDNLDSCIGSRLADRVASDIVIELKGTSRRSYTNTYTKKENTK